MTAGSSPKRSRAASAIARATGCSEAASTAPASRSTSPSPSTSAIRPVVTVPVLSSTTVSTRRVDSSTSGPLIRMPSCAPRPVPTSNAVGVARPSAHGQAMISTATAAVNAADGEPPAPSQKASVATASAMTIGTKTAETRSASRCTRALPVCASSTSRAVCASCVSAPTRVARTTSRPPTLTVAPATASPGPTSTGTLSPVSRLASIADAAVLDHPVGRHLLPRPHHEPVADGQVADRDPQLAAVTQDGDVLRARGPAAPAARRRRGASTGPRSSARPG